MKSKPFKHKWVGQLTCIGVLPDDLSTPEFPVKIEDQGAVLLLQLAPSKAGVFIREAKIPIPESLGHAIYRAFPDGAWPKEIRLEITIFDRPIVAKRTPR